MLYKVMFYGGISISILMLIVSMILFFKLNILNVVYDLTGITAKRKIQEIKDQNAKYGQKKYMPIDINEKKSEVTGKLSMSEKLGWKSKTDKLFKKSNVEEKIHKKEIIHEKEIESNESLTMLLTEDVNYGNETELLQDIEEIGGTEVLTNEDLSLNEFKIIFDVLSIHTDEVI